jgi:hypothetical protein
LIQITEYFMTFIISYMIEQYFTVIIQFMEYSRTFIIYYCLVSRTEKFLKLLLYSSCILAYRYILSFTDIIDQYFTVIVPVLKLVIPFFFLCIHDLYLATIAYLAFSTARVSIYRISFLKYIAC